MRLRTLIPLPSSHSSRTVLALALLCTSCAAAQTLGVSPTQINPPISAPALPSASVLQAPSPLLGSVPSAPTPGALSLTIRDAIDRGLRYNLGLTFSTEATEAARAARLKALSDLLPNFSFRGGE